MKKSDFLLELEDYVCYNIKHTDLSLIKAEGRGPGNSFIASFGTPEALDNWLFYIKANLNGAFYIMIHSASTEYLPQTHLTKVTIYIGTYQKYVEYTLIAKPASDLVFEAAVDEILGS